MSDWPRPIEVTARALCRFNGFHPRRPGARNRNRCRFDFWPRNAGKTAGTRISFAGTLGKMSVRRFSAVLGRRPVAERCRRRRDALRYGIDSTGPGCDCAGTRHCRRPAAFPPLLPPPPPLLLIRERTKYALFPLSCALTVYLSRVRYRTHNAVHISSST